MKRVNSIWVRLEEFLIAFLLLAMTLVTCVYVLLNNLFPIFYYFGDMFEQTRPAVAEWFYSAADILIVPAQEMTWSNAMVKAMFGYLIFLGIAYGVRTAGHIGVDALVKLAGNPLQRKIGLIACLACLSYGIIMMISSFQWAYALFNHPFYAEDLERFGIKQWHIAAVVPVGFALTLIRFVEIFYRILTGQQSDLGLADETKSAMTLADGADLEPRK